MSIAIAALAAMIALVLPVAAHADGFTIKAGDGPCAAPGDLACGSFPDAATAANAQPSLDTFAVAAGSYADGAAFSTQVEITGAPGVIVSDGLEFNGAAGLSKLGAVNVIAPSGDVPAIRAGGAGGLAIKDLTAVSADGDGVVFTSSANNTIERSNVITDEGAKSAVLVDAASGTVTLNIFSSFATGGAAGIRGESGQSGTAVINARHVTAAGSTVGVVADSRGDLPLLIGMGSVAIDVDNSIIFGKTVIDGGPLATEAISVDAPSIESQTEFNPDVLFADPLNRNFRLRPGSPAIDAGGMLTGGESTTDFDGETRAGATTDLGADEYFNAAPKAVIAVKTKIPRDGQPVEFDGSGSSDQPGGSIASYKWDFGDGTTTTTTGPSVTHTYKGEGSVTAKLAVIDGEGAPSGVASANLTILDGGAPAVTISKPKNKQKIFQFVRKTKTVTRNGKKVKVKVKTKKRTRIKLAGAATDKSGVSRVIVTVEKTANAKKKTVAQGSQASTKKCRWLDPKKGLKTRSCNKPILIFAKVKGDAWTYNVRKSIKLSTGTYRVIVYGLDKLGSFGNAAPKASRNVKFTIR